jgi:hypothetical protein
VGKTISQTHISALVSACANTLHSRSVREFRVQRRLLQDVSEACDTN